MAVYHCYAAGISYIIVLFTHNAAGIHAKGTHFILKSIGVIDQLRFIKMLRQVIHHRIGNLYPHPYIHFIIPCNKPQGLRQA